MLEVAILGLGPGATAHVVAILFEANRGEALRGPDILLWYHHLVRDDEQSQRRGSKELEKALRHLDAGGH